MSSLANQLNKIAASSTSTVLDRKKRQKIHSTSLIFEPKVAATQDYSSILSHSLQALEDLEEVNSKFERFKFSLFSETAIGIDRNVQSKEQNDDLDNAIDSFLLLVAPYWNSPLSYNSVEWLVRRFYIHIHNAESLLLSILPYYRTPIFSKVLSIIPNLPPLFSWLTGLKKSGSPVTRESLVKGGFCDIEFVELYTKYLEDLLAKNFVYPNQLIFLVSSMASSFAYNATNEEFLDKLAGLVLKLSAQLLATTKMESQVAANTMLVVLSATIPLSSEIINAVVEGVCANPLNKKSAITTVFKIYQSIQGVPDAFPSQNFDSMFNIIKSDDEEVFKNLVVSDSTDGHKLFISITRRIISEDAFDSFPSLYDVLGKISLSTASRSALINDVIQISTTSIEDKSNLIKFIEYVSKDSKELFINILSEKYNLSVSQFEMDLQHVLTSLKVDETEIDGADLSKSVIIDVDEEEKQSFKQNISESSHAAGSFLVLTKEIDEEFKKLCQLFMKAVKLNFVDEFLSNIFKQNQIYAITFLLRVALTQNCPVVVRVVSLDKTYEAFKNLHDSMFLMTVFPIFLAILSDSNKIIRQKASLALIILKNNAVVAKSNSTMAENLFLKDDIFGAENGPKIVVLAPKDSIKVLDILIDNQSSLVIDKDQLFKIFESLIYTGSLCKKINDLILAYLAENSKIINLPFVKINLMRLVNIGTKSLKNAAASSVIFADFLNEYLTRRPFWIDQCADSKCDFSYFESQILNLLDFGKKSKQHDSKKTSVITSLTFLQKALNSNYQELVDLSVKKLIACFSNLKFDYQIALAQSIIESSTSADTVILYDALLVLQSLPLTTDVFVKLFGNFQLYKNGSQNNMSENGNNNENVPKRRRRSSASTRQAMKKTEVTKLAEVHLRNVIILLETFEKIGTDLQPNSDLLVSLFNLLSDLETLGADGNLPVLYAQESLANCLIISIKNSNKYNVKLESNSIRADVLVSIIRSSNSPQLQNKLLLVISELAILEPEFILHSIMPIFTFMGAYTIKQDDEYSSYVIEQTISKVIPALALNASTSSNQLEEIEFLLTSFISAFNHVPRHRRVKLFSTLSTILKPENSIHIIMFLIGKQYSKASIKHKYNECKLLVDFVKSLMKNFPIADQLTSIEKLIQLWSFIPNSSINEDSDEEVVNQIKWRPIFGPEFLEMNDQDLLLLKKNLINFIDRSIITDSETNSHSLPYLKLQVATLLLNPRASEEDIDSLLAIFNNIISHILLELSGSSRKITSENDSVIEIASKINRKFYKLLNDVLSLLPVKFFVEAIIKLTELTYNEENSIVISNVIFLASRQFELETSDNEVSIESGNKLCGVLVKIVEEYCESPKVEVLEIVQNSLDTLSALVDKFHQSIDNVYMTKIMTLLTKTGANNLSLINNFDTPELIISSLNLISNIVSVIGMKSIAFLSKVLPPSFEVFDKCNNILKKESTKDEESLEDESEDDDDESNTYQLIETSVGLMYSCFIKKMPQIISSNLNRILTELLNENLIKKDIKLSILNIVFTHVDLKVLFKSLLNIWDSKDFQRTSSSTIGLYLNLLTQTIEGLERSATVGCIGIFLKFMISCFEFIRSNDETIFNRNAIARIETLIFNCELQFVMKLNDKAFRPLFSSAVNWTFDNNHLESQDDFVKVSIFLKFFVKLQENLKSIITNYYSYFADHVYKLLDNFSNKNVSINEEYSVNVQRLVLISLNASFRYDQDEYWAVNTRFEKITLALTNQLENTNAKLGKHLTKAITTLAVKNSKVAEHNKALNKLLINHLKVDCSAQEKFSTIKVFENIYVKVGTSWLSLLPQLVPFIAELLEDDDEKIEMEVRSGLVKVIEDVLGESLDKYLS
ncbi:snoRNA-binding rRNA-processing protein [Saccharomycopsis crataegensis]|uniref:U3 small nucleolar RNA-associated protein 10 n=1 Tax=Saccharomycopsis crataegensis TaxID=43959 RepID=A0AAV5QGT5_9ASCO|nr:snoRNA-binding rRNA-processing protein [Saccharomycopsis crataegensis]